LRSLRPQGIPTLQTVLAYRELMARARVRLEQEVARLGGDYAHVSSEHIEPRHDDRTGEAWMYGRFDYELFRRLPISA
jgi:hypothetical protein